MDRPKIRLKETLPKSVPELIDMLDKSIPHRCIKKGESEIDAQRYAGTRDLVDRLIMWMNRS